VSTPMKDVGTTVDRTTIPVCSLKSMTSNQVHALLHSDGSSWIKQHNKSNNNWQMRRERLERTWGKQGESSQCIWDDIYFCRRSRVHVLVFVRALGRLKPNHFRIHLSQNLNDCKWLQVVCNLLQFVSSGLKFWYVWVYRNFLCI